MHHQRETDTEDPVQHYEIKTCIYAHSHACRKLSFDLLLSIQNMMGGGRPAGGRQCTIKDCPFSAIIGLTLSLDHMGDPAETGMIT